MELVMCSQRGSGLETLFTGWGWGVAGTGPRQSWAHSGPLRQWQGPDLLKHSNTRGRTIF